MEKAYWLGRKRASLEMAQNAVDAEARLIHYDLAGRYALNAISHRTQAIDLAALWPHYKNPDTAHSVVEPDDA
jgi:hypothetical protein